MTDTQEQPSKEAQDREVFDRIMGKYTKPEEAREEKKELPPEPAVAFGAPDAEPEAMEQVRELDSPEPLAPVEETPEPQKVAATDRDRHVDYLRLKAKVPSTALESLSDEEVADWAASVREREVGIDRTLEERARYERELAELRQQSEAATQGEAEGPAPTVDLEPVMSKLMDELSLTDEGREAFETFINAKLQPVLSQVESAQRTVQEDQATRTRRLVERVRGELSERFQQLGDDEAFGSVWDTMTRLEGQFQADGRQLDEYLPQLMEAAARVHNFAERNTEAEAAQEAAAREERQQRVADAPTFDSAPIIPEKLTPQQEKYKSDMEVYQAIRRGEYKRRYK